jgi:hypothetical protein
MATVDDKSVLDDTVCYLSGAIDEAEDHGIGFRQRIISIAKDTYGLKIKFLDPTHKLQGLSNEGKNEQDKIKMYKENARWKDLTVFMKKIVRSDLRQVDLCDFLIAKIDKSIHMCGTYNEIVCADIEKKPILTIIEGGKKCAPSWLFGILDHELMFNNEEECVKYLDKINRGVVELDDKWVLFRKQLSEI